MKPHKLKSWVKEGHMSPSSNFTDKVMNSLPATSNAWQKSFYQRMWIVSVLSLIMVLLSLFVSLPQIEVFTYSLAIPRFTITMATMILAAFMILKMLNLKNEVERFQSFS